MNRMYYFAIRQQPNSGQVSIPYANQSDKYLTKSHDFHQPLVCYEMGILRLYLEPLFLFTGRLKL